MIELTDLTPAGRFTVTTASGSQYTLDMAERTATREPRASSNATDADPSSDLRKDGDTLPLIHIIDCVLGKPLTLLLGAVDTYPGYVNTTRRATRVTEIVELP